MGERYFELIGYDEAKKMFGAEKIVKAEKRAVRKARDKGYTKLQRSLRGYWNIKLTDLKHYLHKRGPVGDPPRATISARSKPLSLRVFGARQTKAGVTYKIRRQDHRQTIYEAWEQAGHQVFHRTGARHARVRPRRADARAPESVIGRPRPRLPIMVPRVITVASMFAQGQAWNPTLKAAGEAWEKEFIRQLSLR